MGIVIEVRKRGRWWKVASQASLFPDETLEELAERMSTMYHRDVRVSVPGCVVARYPAERSLQW